MKPSVDEEYPLGNWRQVPAPTATRWELRLRDNDLLAYGMLVKDCMEPWRERVMFFVHGEPAWQRTYIGHFCALRAARKWMAGHQFREEFALGALAK